MSNDDQRSTSLSCVLSLHTHISASFTCVGLNSYIFTSSKFGQHVGSWEDLKQFQMSTFVVITVVKDILHDHLCVGKNSWGFSLWQTFMKPQLTRQVAEWGGSVGEFVQLTHVTGLHSLNTHPGPLDCCNSDETVTVYMLSLVIFTHARQVIWLFFVDRQDLF